MLRAELEALWRKDDIRGFVYDVETGKLNEVGAALSRAAG